MITLNKQNDHFFPYCISIQTFFLHLMLSKVIYIHHIHCMQTLARMPIKADI